MIGVDGAPGLRAQALRGAALLGGQRVIALVVSAVGSIVLARLLGPAEFGAYALIGFAVGLGVTFSDLGLGAALVQRRDGEAADVLATAFTLNVALAVLLGGALAAAAPAILGVLGLGGELVPALRWLAVLIPLAACRMPATVLLERRLAFGPLALGDTLDAVVFQITAVAAAAAGAGVWSFVVGALAARLSALVAVWWAARWRPRLRWRLADARAILVFGAFFQGSTLVGLVRESIVPALVATWSGVAAVGFLNFASTLAFLPLQFIGLAGRVLFPTLSRLQDDRARFAVAAERALNRVAAVLYPPALFLLAGASPVVVVVFGERWLPAVPAVRLLALSALLGGTSTVLVHALYGLGRADLVFRLNLFWAALLWALSLLLVPPLGFVGYALANACTAATAGVTAFVVRRHADIRVLRAVRVPLVAAGTGAVVFGTLLASWGQDVTRLVAAGAAATLVYVACAWLVGGPALRAEWSADVRQAWRGGTP